MLKPNNVYAKRIRIMHNISKDVYSTSLVQDYLYVNKLKKLSADKLSIFDIQITKKRTISLHEQMSTFIDKIKDTNKLAKIYNFINCNTGEQIYDVFTKECKSSFSKFKEYLGISKNLNKTLT